MCAFMVPEYTNEPFLTGETSHGEGETSPLGDWCNLSAIKHGGKAIEREAIDAFAADRGLVLSTVEVVHDRYWCRLTAPGYMDRTEWSGPYRSLTAAKNAIADMYGVDPVTGESDESEES